MFENENIKERIGHPVEFHLSFTIQSPLQFTSPEGGRYNTGDNRPAYNSEGDKHPPLTRTVRRTFAELLNEEYQNKSLISDEAYFSEEIEKEEASEKEASRYQSKSIKLPIIHANSIAGSLRRAAGGFICDTILKSGDTIKREHASILLNGSHSGNPEPVILNQEEFMDVLENPYAGLFGGGQSLYQRRFCVESLIPICDATIDRGLIPDNLVNLKTSDSIQHMFTYEHKIRSEGLFSDFARSSLLPVMAKDKQTQEWINVQANDSRGVKSEARANKAYVYNEFIAPGVTLYGKISTSPLITYEQLGLLIMAINQLVKVGANSPESTIAQFGSMRANGAGKVVGNCDIEFKGAKITGAISPSGNEPELQNFLDKFIERTPEFINSLELDKVFPLKEVSTEQKPKAKKKSA